MSALTKLFVVLLVVCSLLLTAATVVFVNRVENFKQASDLTQKKLEDSNRQLDQSRTQLDAIQRTTQAQIAEATKQLQAKETRINELQQRLAEMQVAQADLSSKLQLNALALTQATEGQKASQGMSTQLQTQTNDLRSSGDKLVKSNADLNATISDLTNRLEVTTRDMKFYQEQLTEAQNRAQALTAKVKDLGGVPTEIASAGTGAGAPAINGVIRETRNIGGIPYATISVGSADNVVKGMKFNVIDRAQGTFLGILTVDSVEPNAATGRLEGPAVDQVRSGSEVRTQL